MPFEIKGPGNRANQTWAMLKRQGSKVPGNSKVQKDLSELLFGLNRLRTKGRADNPSQLCCLKVAARIFTGEEKIGVATLNSGLILPHLYIVFTKINPEDFAVPVKPQLTLAARQETEPIDLGIKQALHGSTESLIY